MYGKNYRFGFAVNPEPLNFEPLNGYETVSIYTIYTYLWEGVDLLDTSPGVIYSVLIIVQIFNLYNILIRARNSSIGPVFVL